jgi:hypothetical protein
MVKWVGDTINWVTTPVRKLTAIGRPSRYAHNVYYVKLYSSTVAARFLSVSP